MPYNRPPVGMGWVRVCRGQELPSRLPRRGRRALAAVLTPPDSEFTCSGVARIERARADKRPSVIQPVYRTRRALGEQLGVVNFRL